ncbi:MAG TPA: FAD-dependent oxidoreductase, partial [Terriglobales bacterium]|nr:FAD-dependent oxidoreductase [Terriglobales bacterium]
IIDAVKAAIEAAGGDVADFSAEVGKAEQVAETREVDYAVAGGGLAGLTAAIAAAEKGAKVVLVEKTAEVGGSLKLAGGNFISVNSAIAKEYGVDDSKEAALTLWHKTADAGPTAPDKYPDYDRVSFYMDRIDSTLTWMKDHGVPYNRASEANPDTMVKIYTDGKGAAVSAALEKAALDAGVEIITDCAVTGLLTENGKVVGFEAEGAALKLTVKATNVMLATGGFGMSPEMMAAEIPAFAAAPAQGGAGNTGDGFKMAKAVGAAFYENPWTIPSGISLNPAFAAAAGDISAVNFRQGILVDAAGKRIVKEDNGIGSVVSNAVAVSAGDVFAIFGSGNADAAKALDLGVASGAVIKADTIEALATAAGIGTELVNTAKLYDADAAKGADSAFGKTEANLIALGEGPFYAVKVAPVQLGTVAGVVTDYDGHVLDASGNIIEGLYAAGEMSNRAFYNQAYVGAASLSLYSTAAILAVEAAID